MTNADVSEIRETWCQALQKLVLSGKAPKHVHFTDSLYESLGAQIVSRSE